MLKALVNIINEHFEHLVQVVLVLAIRGSFSWFQYASLTKSYHCWMYACEYFLTFCNYKIFQAEFACCLLQT